MNFLTVHFILKKHQKPILYPRIGKAFRMVFPRTRSGHSNDLSQPDIVVQFPIPVSGTSQSNHGQGPPPGCYWKNTNVTDWNSGRQSGPVGHYNDPSVVISSRRSGSACRSLSRSVGVHTPQRKSGHCNFRQNDPSVVISSRRSGSACRSLSCGAWCPGRLGTERAVGRYLGLGDNQPSCCLNESDRFDLPVLLWDNRLYQASIVWKGWQQGNTQTDQPTRIGFTVINRGFQPTTTTTHLIRHSLCNQTPAHHHHHPESISFVTACAKKRRDKDFICSKLVPTA